MTAPATPPYATPICAARNDLAASQHGYDEFCTWPLGHPEWSVNPATGYSYNHCNVAMDSWWNDANEALARTSQSAPTPESAS